MCKTDTTFKFCETPMDYEPDTYGKHHKFIMPENNNSIGQFSTNFTYQPVLDNGKFILGTTHGRIINTTGDIKIVKEKDLVARPMGGGDYWGNSDDSIVIDGTSDGSVVMGYDWP